MPQDVRCGALRKQSQPGSHTEVGKPPVVEQLHLSVASISQHFSSVPESSFVWVLTQLLGFTGMGS